MSFENNTKGHFLGRKKLKTGEKKQEGKKGGYLGIERGERKSQNGNS